MGRYTIGSRRYSWEKQGGQRRPPLPEPGPWWLEAIIAVPLVLGTAYLLVPPLFWILAAFVLFIAGCGLVMLLASIALWWERRGGGGKLSDITSEEAPREGAPFSGREVPREDEH